MDRRSSPFDTMTSAFARNAAQSKTWGRDFIPMSAGVNWMPTSPVVKRLLCRELCSDVTIRNYGNPGGLSQPVAGLELVERRLHENRKVKVTLTHGTTEAAWLLFEAWRRAGIFSTGDTAMTVGPAFGYYGRLTADFNLTFCQTLRPGDSTGASMPRAEHIAEALHAKAPRLVVIILPNNPLGEMVDDVCLRAMIDYVVENDARLLVDRVCLMPWDDADWLARRLGPLIEMGLAGVIDSLSKSESLAGLRNGFAVTSADLKAQIVELIKTRFLNPPPFPAATLCAVRLAQHDLRLGGRMGALFSDSIDEIFSEYPVDEDFSIFLKEMIAALPELRDGTAMRRATLVQNFKTLEVAFRDRLASPLRWDAGFNVALATNEMDTSLEAEDAEDLACGSGIGVLTSRCFSWEDHDRYFIRIGLTLPASDFAEGIRRLSAFYAQRQSTPTRGQDLKSTDRRTS